MRQSTDKEIEVFDLDDLFDQYLETDLLHFSDTTAEPSGSDDLAQLFDFPSSNEGEATESSSMPNRDASLDGAWHKALEVLRQNPASPTVQNNSSSIYPESKGKASLSDSELLTFEDLFELDHVEARLSLSNPSTPKPQSAAKRIKKADLNPDRSSVDRSIRNGIQKSTKKLSAFTKMMRPSHFRANIQDIWTRKMDSPTDSFQLANGLPSSPLLSEKLPQNENMQSFYPPDDQPYKVTMSPALDSSAPDISQSNYQLTPLASPAIDINSRNGDRNAFQFPGDNMAMAYLSQHACISSAALSALQTPPSSQCLPMAAWGPETPLDFSFSASPDYDAISSKSQGWWANGSTATVTAPQPSPALCHTAQPRSLSQPQYATPSIAGLGITCEISNFSGFGPDLASLANGHGTTSNGYHSASASFDMPFTPLYHPPTPGIPIGEPHKPHDTPSRSPSQSPQPRFTRRRHSHNHSHSHIHPHAQLPNHNTPRSHQRRKSSNSSEKSSATKSHSVGFVNYTPDDSQKILGGVAPSGSSKTKARREKEAADKRRKLSQAAVKAVIEAGGNLKQLEEGGLLVVE
ncbi:hypothetical protein B0J11DRAFT_424913 [Dendryphion nanum]|uniref:Developmental regulatory protein wetA n=1 Tax=Dendryphion nanum TaxID=256645 RepID=A0A9P9EFF1_9PLEO|nr:hypothetical protein B0J11DRAFT_424913 [Dendryphion nanum]